MGLIRLFLSVHTQDHAPRCVIVPAFFCCRATAAADGAEARVQRLPALRVLTQCTLLPHDLSARQGRTRVALILAKRCNSSSHDVSERAQRRGGASPSPDATIHHLPLPVVIAAGPTSTTGLPRPLPHAAGKEAALELCAPHHGAWFSVCAQRDPRARAAMGSILTAVSTPRSRTLTRPSHATPCALLPLTGEPRQKASL